MNAFLKFNKGMLKMPLAWQPWLMTLVTANMIIPLFYIGRFEARVVLVSRASSTFAAK